jgi:hypothetical protein
MNFLNAKKVQNLMEKFPYQKINLLEVKENINDYKTKSRNINANLFKSASEGFTPQKANFRNKILDMKPHLADQIISTHLSLSNNKLGEYFYKNIYNKFNIDNRMKFAESRNNLFTKSLSKTKNTLRKYEFMRDRDNI